MISNFLPLVDWSWGVIGSIFMFAVFVGLFIMLLLFLSKGKKKDN